MSAEPKRVELTEAERAELDVAGMFPTQFGWEHPEKWEKSTARSIGAKVGRIVASRVARIVAQGYVPVTEVAAREAAARREALLAFADTRGVNVGDEHGEWWQGYRQAQRECLHDATDAALAEPTCATCGHPDHGSCGCTSTVDYDQRNDSNECTCPGPLSERDEESGR